MSCEKTIIIHIDASRALEPSPTGVNVYAREIIEHLAGVDACAQIILYAPAWMRGAAPNIFPRLPAQASWKFLRWPPKFLWTQVRLAAAWARAARNASQNFQVFFAPAHVAPWFSPKNLVVVVHDVAFVSVPRAYSFLERVFARVLTRRNCARAAAIITPSESTKQELVKFFHVPQEKIFVTPFAVPCHVAKNCAQETSVQKTPSQKTPAILFVGRIEYKKGIDRLVDAFEKMHTPARLILVGKPGVGYAALHARIASSPQRDDIIERGFVNDAELAELYHTAAVFALPSRAEGFGFILLEAFARGVPVVAWASGSIPEVAGNAAVIVSDTTSLAAALDKIITDRIFANTLCSAGKARVDEFSWGKTTSGTVRILLKTVT